MPRTNPPYPPEFRAEAVRLVRESGKPLTQIAEDLGVAPQSLRNWILQAEIDAGDREGLTTDEQAELRRLRRENRQLKEWGDLFAAVLDRLLHHAHVISLKGDSYRVRHRIVPPAPKDSSEPST